MATLSALQVAAAAKLGGFSDAQIPTAVAVARGESSFNTDACTGQYCGLWQIGTQVNKEHLHGGSYKDPVVNARAAKELVDSRGWCGGKASNGHCLNFEAYGLDNGGMSWSAKLAEGQRALAELTAAMQGGKTPQQILGSSSSIQPISLPNPLDPLGATQAAKNIGDVMDAFFKAITNRNTWIRVSEIMIGAMLINFGLQKAVGIDAKKVLNVVVGGKAKAAKAMAASTAVKGK